MSKLDNIFPKWISPRAFLAAALMSAPNAYKTIETYGFGMESMYSAIVGVLVGGVFGGWLLTKFFPNYFGRS